MMRVVKYVHRLFKQSRSVFLFGVNLGKNMFQMLLTLEAGIEPGQSLRKRPISYGLPHGSFQESAILAGPFLSYKLFVGKASMIARHS